MSFGDTFRRKLLHLLMQARRPLWIPHRPEVAAGLAEASLLRTKQFACTRCAEEVAPGAVWCPHCGYDMTITGPLVRRGTIPKAWHQSFEDAGQRFVWGCLAAVIALVVFLALSATSGFRGWVFGGIAFILALLFFAAELSLRALVCALPTMAIVATLALLSVK